MHLLSVLNEDVQDFTQTWWETYRTSLRRWLCLQGETKDLAETYKHCVDMDFDNRTEDARFHATCYRRFIDKKRLCAAEKCITETEGEQQDTEAGQAVPSSSGVVQAAE